VTNLFVTTWSVFILSGQGCRDSKALNRRSRRHDHREIADNAPSLSADQRLFVPKEPYWFSADNQQSAEKHWLVWAERPVAELEAVKKWLNEKDGGAIRDANEIRSAQQFLNQNYSAARPVAEKDEHQTHLKGGRDGVLVHPVKLEHR